MISLILVSYVHAEENQNPDNPDNPTVDYSSADFYEKSDPKTWDYTKVNYKLIPDDKYSQLDYGKVDYTQIDYTKVDYDKVPDHSKIDVTKYVNDLGCSGCAIDRGGQNLQFSKEGLTHPNGDKVSVPGNYPPGSLYAASKDRITVALPKEVKSIDMLDSKDKVTLHTQDDLFIDENKKVYGDISFDKSEPYVKKGDTAEINGVEIKAKGNDVNVYFDQKTHTGNYVDFNEKEFYASGDKFQVNFLKEQNYVQVADFQNVDFLNQNDLFKAELKKGSIDVINRDDQNNMPLVITGGKVQIENDENTIYAKENKISLYTDFQKEMYGKKGGEVLTSRDSHGLGDNDYGAVFMEIQAGTDDTKHYMLDDNHNIFIENQVQYTKQADDRKEIKDTYNVGLLGYFSEKELGDFKNQLSDINQRSETQFLFQKDNGMMIWAIDERTKPGLDTGAWVDPRLTQPTVFWTPEYEIKNNQQYKQTGLFEKADLEEYYNHVLYHEVGHTINNEYSKESTLSSDVDKDSDSLVMRWINVLEGDGMTITEKPGTYDPGQVADSSKGTVYVPAKFGISKDKFTQDEYTKLYSDLKSGDSLYAKTSVGEGQAVLYEATYDDETWFTDPKRVVGAKDAADAERILQIRRDLRDVIMNKDGHTAENTD